MTISHRARGDRGAREGDRPDAAAARSTAGSSTRSRCRGTGASAARRTGRRRQRPRSRCRATRTSSIQESKAFTCDVRAGRRTRPRRTELAGVAPTDRRRRAANRRPPDAEEPTMTRRAASSAGEIAVRTRRRQRMGFFTDTTICIGCKACEVACKQWNDLPADGGELRAGGSYDHTGALGGVDLAPRALRRDARAARRRRSLPAARRLGASWTSRRATARPLDRWVFMSDVCKHCTNAGCLDACPTGALIRTEFETVDVQPDVCNGCGYCIPSCPFGVIDRDHDDGRAAKCTLCYDRLEDGLEPACAKACPTDSIQFGPYDELVDARAAARRHAARARHRGAPTCTAPATRRATSWPAASARSSCSPSRPSATGCRRRPTRRSRRTSCRPRWRRSAPGCSRRAARRSRSRPPARPRRRAALGGTRWRAAATATWPPRRRQARRREPRRAGARRRPPRRSATRRRRSARRASPARWRRARSTARGRRCTAALAATRAGRSCSSDDTATRAADAAGRRGGAGARERRPSSRAR